MYIFDMNEAGLLVLALSGQTSLPFSVNLRLILQALQDDVRPQFKNILLYMIIL